MDALPIITPSMVRTERSLLASSAWAESFHISAQKADWLSRLAMLIVINRAFVSLNGIPEGLEPHVGPARSRGCAAEAWGDRAWNLFTTHTAPLWRNYGSGARSFRLFEPRQARLCVFELWVQLERSAILFGCFRSLSLRLI